MPAEQPLDRPTVIAESPWVFVAMWAGFPILGGGLLWGLSLLSGWIASLPWAPFQGLFRLISSIPQPQLTIGAVAIGTLLGLAVALLGHADSLRLSITPQQITSSRGGRHKHVPTCEVSSAFIDRKYLVLLDAAGTELLREKSDIPAERIRRVFIDTGMSWQDTDPFAGQWRRWLDGMVGLPAGANALLRAREKELKKVVPDDDDVRGELRRLGVMVRDEKGKQYWRVVPD
jgi:hypothetical protein